LVDWKFDPGSTKMLIQEHVALDENTFTAKRLCLHMLSNES